MPSSAAEGRGGRGHTSAHLSVTKSAKVTGQFEAEISSRQETQLFGAAQTAAQDSTGNFRSHGLSRSDLGMWSMSRGNRMPVRSRVRPVLFMHRSLSARL